LFLSFILISFFISFLPVNYKLEHVEHKNTVFCSTESELNDNINDQLDDIDFSQLEDDFTKVNDNNLLPGLTFKGIVEKFINADTGSFQNSFFSYLISVMFNTVIAYIPYFAGIVAIALIYSLVGQFSTEKNKSVGSLINVVCFISIAVMSLKIVIDLMNSVSKTILMIEGQMEVVFPILLTLITAIGSVVTVGTFQPTLAVLSSIITKLFTCILIPIFIFSVVFSIVGNISKNIKLEKFSKFFLSLFNWVIGVVFTIFIAFITIQGLTSSSLDAVSLKTAKFAIKSYIPVVGSYLSDGVGLIVASSIIIKNAVGASGLILLGATILVPIINIAVIMLLFKLVSAILETVCEPQIPNFLFALSKSLNMLNVCLISVGFMYLVSVSILMCCSNVF